VVSLISKQPSRDVVERFEHADEIYRREH